MKETELFEDKRVQPEILNRLINPDLQRLASLYSEHGHELRIVGGAVRDILLTKEPKDIDLASDATPQESIDLLIAADIRVFETGLQHGTITAHINGEDYEITTLRIDVASDGRHAEVEFTKDWEIDAERRDLTFNAMSLDFDGNLYDYFGGHDDLRAGRAKFVGDARRRIEEDYLRILRYYRFLGRTENPEPDDDTLRQIAIHSSGLQQISGERIWSEFGKILSGNHLLTIIHLMADSGVLQDINLGNADINELLQVKQRTDNSLLLMAAMVKSVSDLDSINKRWKFSNVEYSLMQFIINHRSATVDLEEAKKRHILNRESIDHLCKLFEYHGTLQLANDLRQWQVPVFPITGNDLLQAGMSPGPDVGKALHALLTRWVASNYTLSTQQLMDLI